MKPVHAPRLHCPAVALAVAVASGCAWPQQATFQVRSLTPDAALRAARAAMAACAKNGHQVAVAVADRSGQPLVMLRDRYAGPHTPQTAISKAYTALTFKLDTTAFAHATRAGEAAAGIRHLAGVVAIGGGWPIESGGALVGAIGVSGAPGGDADDVCAKAGIAEIRDDLEL